jgi:hypothetical protein
MTDLYPRAGISIRKPSFEIPCEEPTAASSTAAATSTARSSKSENLMAASPGLLSSRYELILVVQ